MTMRSSRFVRTAPVLFAFFVVLVVSVQGQENGEKPSSQLIIAAPESTVEAGADIPLNITFTNSSHVTLRVMLSPEEAAEVGYMISVRDSQGRTVPKTDYYQKLLNGVHWIGKFTELRPGENLEDDLLLNKLYDMSQPDVYSIQVKRPGMVFPENAIPAQSNIITLTIVPSSGVAKPAPANSPAHPSFGIDISASQYRVHVGTPVTFQIRLTNLSDHEIVIPQEAGKKGELDFKVKVLVNGEEAPKTSYGRTLDDVRASMPAENWKSVTLAPGKSFVENVTLSDLYDFSQPGRYLVHVERTDETVRIRRQAMVKSDASVTVVP